MIVTVLPSGGNFNCRYAGVLIVANQSAIWQIARTDVRPGLRGARVLVEQRWDKAMAVRFGGRCLMVQACSAKPAGVKPLRQTPRSRTGLPGPKVWMRDFELKKAVPLWAILQGEGGDRATE